MASLKRAVPAVGSKRFWLFKSEPNTRIEKGHDVSYSISKFQQDGVEVTQLMVLF